MTVLPIYYVNAFSSTPFSGNPAAVVLLEEWLPDATLITLASEINLPETAFLVDDHIRWFTPKIEVPLCGHATLATAFVLKTIKHAPDNLFKFHSLSGELTVSCQDSFFTLDFPTIPATLNNGIKSQLETQLNLIINEVWQAHDRYVCFLSDPKTVINYQPDFTQIAQLDLPGVIITAKGNKPFDFISRFFAPVKGVNEDPVTGTSHCVLAPIWSDKLNKKQLHARQVSKRGGNIDCELKNGRILLTGDATLFLAGEITF
ncbi:PhzF family phenazine biosynthesis protein [Proteus vulgaris]|uniref:PhzF family phenazine biosynthesis protein n=1 Tax=Proteus TaxID=583 RepID=UPI001D0A6D6E|nr:MULTISPECIES: PhzF family phenazine biosynthesis isomerase [Proteus]UDN34658.1 PhzF family phenazine biosynthesis protein [Proteus sp. NMG38-2]UPK79764.1 PhzF family phenazine biosynthesis protein [Proteus vulgaris]